MKIVKIVIGLLVAYAVVVIVFESLLGYYQPENEDTLVLVTSDDAGQHSRVLSTIETDRGLYVSVNHWPRAWYHRLQDNPQVTVTLRDNTGDYKAVLIEDDSDEYQHVVAARPHGLVFRILTGFPPRHVVRLDPLVPAVQEETIQVIEDPVIEEEGAMDEPAALEQANQN